MATKIRLQRLGKRGNAYFHVVVVDSRKKRNGSYIEKIGSYNPNTNPATIQLDFDRALYWVKQGAGMTDTMRAMLSYRGVLIRKHLDRGVVKGVMTQEQADAKFNKWMETKTSAIDAKRTRVEKTKSEAEKQRLDAEAAVKAARAQKIQEKKESEAKAAAEAKAAEEAAKAATPAPVAETPSDAQTPAAETPSEPVAPETAPDAPQA